MAVSIAAIAMVMSIACTPTPSTLARGNTASSPGKCAIRYSSVHYIDLWFVDATLVGREQLRIKRDILVRDRVSGKSLAAFEPFRGFLVGDNRSISQPLSRRRRAQVEIVDGISCGFAKSR